MLKIQLERETQAALDPEVGQSEVRAMEKEIHRMRIRAEALKRATERAAHATAGLLDARRQGCELAAALGALDTWRARAAARGAMSRLRARAPAHALSQSTSAFRW